MFKNSYIQNIKLFLISFVIISFIFLSDIKHEYFQFRFFILLLLIPCAFKFYHDIKLKNYKFLIYFLLLFVFLFTHIGLNLYYDKFEISNYSLFGITFLLIIFTVSFYYFDYINVNINFIITSFIIIFLISCIFSIFKYEPDSPFFCGGISNFIKSNLLLEKYGFGLNSYELEYRINEVRLSFKEFIFSENSHLGMIAPGIIAYSIYKMNNQRLSIIENIFFIIFIIICFIKSSTTLYVGTILSLVTLIIFNFKNLNRKTIFYFLILIIFCITTLLSNKECRARFVPIYGDNWINAEKFGNDNDRTGPIKLTNQTSDNSIGGVNKDLAKKIKDKFKVSGNLSSGVYFHSFLIALKSISEKPLGWGFNRYNQAFSYFNTKQPSKIEILNRINNKDGSNNFVKIVVEFGVFSIVFYLFCFLFLINNRITIDLKLIYLPIVITESVRGAGYFNGGFSLIVFIMLFTYINISKN